MSSTTTSSSYTGRARDYQAIEVDFDPEPGYELLFDGLRGHEELGRPFLYELDLSTGKVREDIQKLVGASATVWMLQADKSQLTEDGTATGGSSKEDEYFINGVVTRVVSAGLSGGTYRYRIEIRPNIWLLSQITEIRIFQKKSAFKIITDILQKEGFLFEDKRQASAGDTELEYCVQYRETSLDFITRLMEHFGIYYSFKHERNKHTILLADDPNAHEKLTDDLPFKYDQSEVRAVKDRCWGWTADLSLHSGKFTYRDYNFETPSADLTAKALKEGQHTHGSYEVYEYPGPYDETGLGQDLSYVRMQAIAADRAVYRAVSNSRKLRPGMKFKLKDHPETGLNKEYLVTYAEFDIAIAEGRSTYHDDGEMFDTYRIAMRAIPGDTPFRLHRQTKRPLIRGPQTARVVGAAGDEIMTDKYGRIKVHFHWDRSETQDEERTCWIRVAQSWAGSGWGSIYIPRVGQEVVVEFLEGNPDRPLVTGVVYNANNSVPYTLPANKTQTGLKTNSSTGGSGSNEFRFEDKAGSEEVYFHAQKDYNKVVKNNETHKVEEGNRSITVSTGNDSKTVSSGNHSIDVSAGSSKITAAQSIELTVGGNTIKIDTSGISINGMTLKLEGSATTDVKAGASMTINGGGSLTVSAGMVSIN